MSVSPPTPAGTSAIEQRADRKLFLFDCYDTLVVESDSDHRPDLAALFAHRLGIRDLLAKRVLYPVLSGAFRAEHQERTETVLRRGLDRHGLHDVSDEEAAEALWYAAGNADGRYRAASGSHALLNQLRDEGHVVRLISNCVLAPGGMNRLLESVGLAGHITVAHYSSEGRGKKPDPDFFRQAGDGQWAEVVMVGDSVPLDLEPARALGWQAVRIDPHKPCWSAVTAHLNPPARDAPSSRS